MRSGPVMTAVVGQAKRANALHLQQSSAREACRRVDASTVNRSRPSFDLLGPDPAHTKGREDLRI